MNQSSPPILLPILQRLVLFGQPPLTLLSNLVKHHDIVRFPMLRPAYIVNDPQAIMHILLSNEANYTKTDTSYERLELVLGKGLLTTSGEDWAARRQQYQAKFQGKEVKKYLATIQACTEKLCQQWGKKSGQVINIAEDMLALAMNISSISLLGQDIGDHAQQVVRWIHLLNKYTVQSFSLAKWMPTLRNLRYQKAHRELDHFLLNTYRQRSKQSSDCLLSDLFDKDDAGNFRYDDNAFLGEVKNFFIAGHETTGNALSWILYCLVKHPYVLHRVISELNEVLKTKELDHETLAELSYLSLVIKEGLRLYPPIWMVTRKVIAEDQLLNITVPANALVNVSPYLIHRHPKYWQQPDIFYPERFLTADESRPKGAYIPFSVGPRVCIGKQFAELSLKTILAMLLKQFRFEFPNKEYTVNPIPLITLKPSNGVRLKILRQCST